MRPRFPLRRTCQKMMVPRIWKITLASTKRANARPTGIQPSPTATAAGRMEAMLSIDRKKPIRSTMWYQPTWGDAAEAPEALLDHAEPLPVAHRVEDRLHRTEGVATVLLDLLGVGPRHRLAELEAGEGHVLAVLAGDVDPHHEVEILAGHLAPQADPESTDLRRNRLCPITGTWFPSNWQRDGMAMS